ncbi:hypothetical protein O1611_g7612 [Lasiodiplodia mahajangana]|uniref:Uncharacterized protein n=1 Tax=Lasiodiplodia mahajangana TaxID=1108764 RepID=A0ACC2JF13_9PEZI|nr:hypothetical protein O1611_g7612 [Lasiodiplodia mahajangana]
MSTCTKTVSYTSESTGWSKITPGADACVPTETCVLPFGETTTTIEPSVSQWVAATGIPGPAGVIPKPGTDSLSREFVDELQQLYKELGIERDYGIPDPTCQRSKLYAPQREGDGSPDVSSTFEKWCKDMAGTKVVKAPEGTDTFFNRFGFRDYSFWLSANSRYRSPFDCGDETTIDEHECVNTLNSAMITCDPDSGATHGASKDGRCLQYNITLSWSIDDQSPPWNPLPEPQCEGSSSGVYYTFFDALFPKFCQAADDNDDDEFSRTFTNKDIDTDESTADISVGELRKRTPPASPNSYDGYKFHFDWSAHNGGPPCRKSCHRAFQDFANVCGVTGGMENAMTKQGSIDVDCGVYRYNIEIPPPPPEPSYTTIPAANPTRPVGCYKENTDCTLYDADPDTAHEKTDTFCDDHADYAGHLGWDGIEDSSKDVGQYIGWYFKVEWKKDCKDPDRTFLNVGQPIKSYSCKEAFRLAFDGCTDNGGRGGLVEVGCLQYFFNPTDRPDFSHVADSCLNPYGPFE